MKNVFLFGMLFILVGCGRINTQEPNGGVVESIVNDDEICNYFVRHNFSDKRNVYGRGFQEYFVGSARVSEIVDSCSKFNIGDTVQLHLVKVSK